MPGSGSEESLAIVSAQHLAQICKTLTEHKPLVEVYVLSSTDWKLSQQMVLIHRGNSVRQIRQAIDSKSLNKKMLVVWWPYKSVHQKWLFKKMTSPSAL